MATFSNDQSRHLYVVKANQAAALSAVGDVLVGGVNGSEFHIKYQSPGGVTRTDIVPIKNITYAKSVIAKPTYLKKVKVALASGYTVVAGKDYLVRIITTGQYDQSPETQYVKYGVFRAVTTTAADLYAGLKNSLIANFSREPHQLFTFTSDSNGVYITENMPPYKLGKIQDSRISFTVLCPDVTDSTNSYDVTWATVSDVTLSDTATLTAREVFNGRKVADMEWFYIGERGDQYRTSGYPNNFDTEYVASTSSKYDFIEIEYFYAGDGEDVQRSKKQLTLALVSDDTIVEPETEYALGTVATAVKAALVTKGVTFA